MPKEKEESVFYVGIKDPIEIRRSILESSKELLQYLQRAEKFKAVRKEKTHQLEKLREEMKEIQALAKKLKALLPKTGLRAKAKPKPAAKKEAPKAQVKQEPIKETIPSMPAPKAEEPKEMSELEKLEAELGEIEGRLTKLS
jgi:hypothetical protein